MKRPSVTRLITIVGVQLVVLFVVIEVILRVTGFTHEVMKPTLWKPTVIYYASTVENYIQCAFDPPGYTWIRQDNIAGRDSAGRYTYRWPVEKEPGKVRIAFVGASASEENPFCYPLRFEKLMNRLAGTNKYERLNVACSSYSTHQGVIALQRYVLPRNPDAVIVYQGWNDSAILSNDGNPDKSKDTLIEQYQKQQQKPEDPSSLKSKIQKLSVMQLVAKLKNRLNRSWPSPRVTPQDFKENLRTMIKLCEARQIPIYIVKLPNHPWIKLSESATFDDLWHQVYGHAYGTDDEAIYKAFWEIYSGIQVEVVKEEPWAKMIDTWPIMKAAEENLKPGFEEVHIFEDQAHLTKLGYQKFAEALARNIAPEYTEALDAYVDSPAYWSDMTAYFEEQDSPYEYVYAAHQVLDRDPSRKVELAPKIEAMKTQFKFLELFKRGRWGGTTDPDISWQEKIKILHQCLDMRPNDYGVMLQIFRVCMYSGNVGAAADAMAKFKPATPQDKYQHLKLTLSSLLQAQQWQRAEPIAREVLNMSPNDQEARSFLQQLEQAKARAAMQRF